MMPPGTGEPGQELEERLLQAMAQTVEAARTTGDPFQIALHFRNGVIVRHMVTSFETQENPAGGIFSGTWTQLQAKPGEELLQYVNWDEVQMITSRTLENPE